MTSRVHLSALFLCYCSVATWHVCNGQLHLLRHLLDKNGTARSPIARPVVNNQPILIYMAFNIQQIIDLNVKEQYLATSMWIEQQWNDVTLTWNASDFGNISRIRLPPNTIWRPDILLYNSADRNYDGTWPVNAVIRNDGFVSYVPPAILKSTCRVNIRWFPFDLQHCVMRFGSWTYDDNEVNLTLRTPAILDQEYVENGEFTIEYRAAERIDKPFTYGDGTVENFPYIALCFYLKRRELFYNFNLLMPAMLIGMLAILVFLLPANSGEKMGLSVTVLLSLTVFTMAVAESMPHTSDAAPLLGLYFFILMVICSIAVVLSICTLNLHHAKDLGKNTPNWVIHWICLRLAKLVFMKAPDEYRYFYLPVHQRAAASEEYAGDFGLAQFDADADADANENGNGNAKASLHEAVETEERFAKSYTDQLIGDAESSVGPSLRNAAVGTSCDTGLSPDALLTSDDLRLCLCSQMNIVLDELRSLKLKVLHQKLHQREAIIWCFASTVVDRACLYLFTLFTLAFGLFVFLFRPTYETLGADCDTM